MIDLFLVYQFIRRLVTPFKDWPAYKYGIIDENGNILRKRKELRTIKERDVWGKFDVMILKLKKLLAKVPGGQTRLATYAAALWLIKENERIEHEGEFMTEEQILSELNECMSLVEETVGPVNSAGSGNVAGIGVGPDGEPGFTPKQMKRYKKKNEKDAKRVPKGIV